VRVHDDDRTEFQQRVFAATRRIPFGNTLSYGELATEVGSPKAARAVGAVMASNHVPIIIPCHRVIGRHGELTGFSAPRGVSLKRQLLELEANAVQGR
jgi:methylated-DNA-[protein]-cysteine S-methyltransferase